MKIPPGAQNSQIKMRIPEQNIWNIYCRDGNFSFLGDGERKGGDFSAFDDARASCKMRLSLVASVIPQSDAKVGAISAGVADEKYLPGRIPQPIRITGTR